MCLPPAPSLSHCVPWAHWLHLSGLRFPVCIMGVPARQAPHVAHDGHLVSGISPLPIPNCMSLAGTNGHNLSGLSHRTLFSHGLGAGSPESGWIGPWSLGNPQGRALPSPLLTRVAGDAWRGAADLQPLPLRSWGPPPVSPCPCLSSSSYQDALLHVTSSQRATSATTLLPNKVTFTGTRVGTSAPRFGDTTQPRTQTCPSSPTPSVVSGQRMPHVGVALSRLSPSFPGLPLLSVLPPTPFLTRLRLCPHPSSLPG